MPVCRDFYYKGLGSGGFWFLVIGSVQGSLLQGHVGEASLSDVRPAAFLGSVQPVVCQSAGNQVSLRSTTQPADVSLTLQVLSLTLQKIQEGETGC